MEVASGTDLGALGAAREFLASARSRFAESYEVQTTRIATQPLPRYVPSWMSPQGLGLVQELDRLASDAGVVLSVGPVLTEDGDVPGFASWATDLVQSTAATSFSSFVATPEHGVHHRAVRAAAEAVSAIAHGTPGGEGNFRYCATAFCPPGTPFFPAAYHAGPRAFSIGLESPRLLSAALDGTTTQAEAERSMRSRLNAALRPVQVLAEAISQETGWRYLGIDTSPKDIVLANRADEGRYGVAELLLYSSVCGTGLDVVPLAGDIPVSALADAIEDVAALAARYQKPLSARLFPVPGKGVGDVVDFDNPHLTRCEVMALGYEDHGV